MSIAMIERVAPLKPIRKTTRARRRAPRHPVKPEKRLRKAVRDILREYHRHLVEAVMHAVKFRSRKLDQSEDGNPLPGAMRSVAHYGAYLLAHSAFKRELAGAADDTAASAKKQTERAVKRTVATDLETQRDDFGKWVTEDVDKRMAASLERAQSVYDIWDELTEESEDFEDEDALERRLDEGLDGIVGGALAYASLAFGGAFADMIQAAQTDTGVSTYTWLSQLDSKVRPSHEALDGQSCSWDDPPLQPGEEPAGDPAIDSPAHPGESPNCRCVASPDEPEDKPN